jgi:hypothetical protein
LFKNYKELKDLFGLEERKVGGWKILCFSLCMFGSNDEKVKK